MGMLSAKLKKQNMLNTKQKFRVFGRQAHGVGHVMPYVNISNLLNHFCFL